MKKFHVGSGRFHSGHLSFFFRPNCYKHIQVYELFVNVVPEMLINETVVVIDSIQLFS